MSTVKQIVIHCPARLCLSPRSPFCRFPRAQSASEAQGYVQTGAQTAVAILQDKSAAPDVRRAHIHAFLLLILDTQRIASYTLGPALQTASLADVAAYSNAFRDGDVIGYDAMLDLIPEKRSA